MIGLGPSMTLKSDGTVNNDASGSDREMFVSLKTCSPMRGLRRIWASLSLSEDETC